MRVAQVEWTGGANAGITGPTVDFVNFFSTRGVLTTPVVPAEQAGAATLGLSYQVTVFAPASSRSDVPARDQAAVPAADAACGSDVVRRAEPDPGLRRLRLAQCPAIQGRVASTTSGVSACLVVTP